MPIAIEVNLRLPNITVRPANDRARVISNADVRFLKRMEVPALPHVGDALPLSIHGGQVVTATIKRVDWHDDKAMFVVGCQLATRSMSFDAYESLRADPDWVVKPLV
jgi:hypothetical protein